MLIFQRRLCENHCLTMDGFKPYSLPAEMCAGHLWGIQSLLTFSTGARATSLVALMPYVDAEQARDRTHVGAN